eukprot:jgi/Tetstr1/460069/TSEL_005389.t1
MGMGRANGGGGAARRPLKGHTEVVACVAFSPDGTRLASASRDNTLRVWSAVTGEEVLPRPLRGHTGMVTSVAFSPDGKRLALHGLHVPGECVKGQDTTGVERDPEAQPQPLAGHTRMVISLALSPDGKQRASASEDKTVRV